MSVPVAGCLLDFYVFAKFNAVVGVDCGPGTDYPIRYSLADYKKMLRRHARDWLQGGTWGGPIEFNADVVWHTQTGGVHGQQPGSVDPADPFNFRVGALVEPPMAEGTTIPDYFLCPIDGGGPDREPATILNSVFAAWGVTITLFGPRIESAWWNDMDPLDGTDHVWLKFTLGSPEASSTLSYICQPSETSGGDPSVPISSTQFLGIDFAGSSAFPSATQSYLLGDGTTEAFFEDDPAATDFLIVTQLDTRVGL